MSDNVRRFGVEILNSELGEFTALEAQEFIYSAGLGLDRRTIERYLKEATFCHLIVPVAWKPGRGHKQPDKTILTNAARWRRGPLFDEIVGNGSEVNARPAHA